VNILPPIEAGVCSQTVSAYANFGTGKILFGVDDGNKIGIINPKEVCLDIENKINDVIEPRPH